MMRVLVIDDFTGMRDVLIDILREHSDVDVVGAGGNGQDAVELAESRRPDVIVMDITMPRCSGVEATRIITQRFPDMRVIGVTALDDDASEAAMRDAGACGFLLKEQAPDRLYSLVHAAHYR
ncbi:hypothetical protein W02_31340 [Nitrospira sp. KM1]|uniref:response regulator n=1 Tax=Nitrospira sp. KM1 TaxID=1936990 RepID=UPI0013A77316|nr:response regulator transcription factor [Nitrospira sp. KM1]BCA55994.1 hypothetical protein W02_31340 [Nitrospira sp. KM1]